MTDRSSSHPENALLFLADHPVLDFLNTVAMSEGKPRDLLQSDDDVLRWLVQAKLYSGDDNAQFAAGNLLHEARHFRDIMSSLVQRKKQALPLDVTAMNHFLASCSNYPQLFIQADNRLASRRIYPAPSPAVLMAPVAEQAVALLTDGNFALVRKCEHQDCILWFYDRTKGHRRRWCSMALCGNRAKVAKFRHLRKQAH